MADTDQSNIALLGHLHWVAAEIASAKRLGNGYRIVVNTGADGGQTVDHLHLHLLGGRHSPGRQDRSPESREESRNRFTQKQEKRLPQRTLSWLRYLTFSNCRKRKGPHCRQPGLITTNQYPLTTAFPTPAAGSTLLPLPARSGAAGWAGSARKPSAASPCRSRPRWPSSSGRPADDSGSR